MQLTKQFKKAQRREALVEAFTDMSVNTHDDFLRAARARYASVKDQPHTVEAALSRGILDKSLPNHIPL